MSETEFVTSTLVCDIAIPTANTYYRKWHDVIVISKKGREFKEKIAACCRGKPKVMGPVTMFLWYHRGDAVHYDMDNLLKPLLDALKNRMFEDDEKVRQIIPTKIMGMYDQPTGFEVTIVPYIDLFPLPVSKKRKRSPKASPSTSGRKRSSKSSSSSKNKKTKAISLPPPLKKKKRGGEKMQSKWEANN